MTLRAHIYIVNNCHVRRSLVLCVAAAGVFLACGGKAPVAGPSTKAEGLQVEKLDVSSRGRTDTWRYTQPAAEGKSAQLVREEKDLNGDGRVDFTKSLDADGTVRTIQMDLDFDGRPDQVETYEGGKLVKVERSQSLSGKFDSWRFFDHGDLIRVERDTNGDGKVDEWEYYEKNRLARTGRDLNFDGIVDLWEE